MTLIRDARVDTSPFLAAAMRGVDAARVVMGVRHGISQPLHHGDPVAEYWSLVDGVTLWDIASQRHVEVSGPDARAFVQSLVTRDLSGHEVGQAKYAFMTDTDGRIVCDPVVLRLDDDRYWLTASASGVEGWCRAQADAAAADVTVSVPDAAAVQLQGPQAAAVMDDLFGDDLPTLGYHRFVRRRFDTVDLATQYIAPPIMLSDWVPNVGQKNNPDIAGLRTVLLNASLSPWRRSAGQSTTHNWTTDLRFSGTDEEPPIRYQWLQAAPTFTEGVMDVPEPVSTP